MTGFASLQYDVCVSRAELRDPGTKGVPRVSLARPADRIRARALRARAVRYPWLGAARLTGGPTGEPAAASRPAATPVDGRGPEPGLATPGPAPEIAPSESV